MAYFDSGAHAFDTHEPMAVGALSDTLYQLGVQYTIGRDVPMCLVTAHKWFNIAASRGNMDARRYRSEISMEMSRADVSKAQRLAREWLKSQ
jgi:uncharacterized protein